MAAYQYYSGVLTKILDTGLGFPSYDVLTFSPVDMWVCGTDNTHVNLHHYNGSTWIQFLSSVLGTFMCLGGGSSNDLYVGGTTGYIASLGSPLLYHYNGSAFTQITLPVVGDGTGVLTGILYLSATNVYAIGYRPNGSWFPLVFHYDGSNWTSLMASYDYGLAGTGVWGTDSSHIWIPTYGIAYSGGVIFYNGSIFSLSLAPWDYGWVYALYAIFGFNNSDIWAVGHQIITHFNGETWTQITDPVPADQMNWQGVWGSATNDVYIAGVSGANTEVRKIAHWDGSIFTAVYTETDAQSTSFNGISGV
jgi:hypothetical protein